MPRCFAAILLDEAVRAAVAGVVDRLRPLGRSVAWVPAPNLHLTLRFLAEQGAPRVAAAVEALEEAAATADPFSLALAGVGGFPGLERPRVLWVGVAEGAVEARALVERLEDGLDRRGFGREARPWHPHVTIGRVFDQRRWQREGGGELRPAVAAAARSAFGAFTVRAVALMASEPSPAGVRYRELAGVPLRGG